MFRAEVAETFTDAPLNLVSGIGDMMLATIGGRVLLYTSTRAGGGLMVLEVGASLGLLAQTTIRTGGQLSAPPSLDLYEFGGRQHLIFSGGAETSLVALRLSADGTPAATVRPPGGPQGVITAQALVNLNGQRVLYAAMAGEGAVQAWQVAADGAMTRIAGLPPAAGPAGVNISAMSAFSLGASQYLATASLTADRIALFRIGPDGALTHTASIGMDEGLGITDPAALRVVSAHGQTWLVAASAGSSSLTLFAVSSTGALSVADHVIDTADTRFQGVRAVEAITIGGRAFLVAGGGDGGLHVFEILPGGRLILSATVLHEPGLALANITALLLNPVADGFEIFVAGEGAGITRLRLTTGPLAGPITGGNGADSLSGGAAHDLILGGGGDDTLRGGAGNDILVDGTGRDRLWGGAGEDVFVLTADGESDTIHDFQPGLDRIDISAWGRIYGLSALNITPMATGAVIRFGTEELVVYSANGLPLTTSSFASAGMFGLWHADAVLSLPGGRILGTPRSDHLTGTEGDDVFIASAGADTLTGGGGFDRVDYSGFTGPIIADLGAMRGVSDPIAGHVYQSIEALTGTAWADGLSGSSADNLLEGGAGDDTLYGRGGRDTLRGGDGNDLLVGGPGMDLLDGGDGTDLAWYGDAAVGLTVDMLLPGQSTFDAAGDIFLDVENLTGSLWSDLLLGNHSDNLINGSLGDDTLYGRGGNDTLLGGAGDDLLIGGPGADLLIGGEGIDQAWYAASAVGLTVDMLLPGQSTFDAAGDMFSGVENLTGSSWSDLLRGDNLGNLINGFSGNDTILGRGGNDTLLGGVGDDVLIGGAGADLLVGGPGTDHAFYWDSPVGLSVDMIVPEAGTFDAAGDMFSGVENLTGSSWSDLLRGDNLGNLISGLSGNDTILGRGGNDTLLGGEGNDFLGGGLGNDLLIGGPGADVFVFDSGRDVIADFNAGEDLIRLPIALLGSVSPSPRDLLAAVAYADPASHAVHLVFSAAHQLTITGISDLALLESRLILF